MEKGLSLCRIIQREFPHTEIGESVRKAYFILYDCENNIAVDISGAVEPERQRFYQTDPITPVGQERLVVLNQLLRGQMSAEEQRERYIEGFSDEKLSGEKYDEISQLLGRYGELLTTAQRNRESLGELEHALHGALGRAGIAEEPSDDEIVDPASLSRKTREKLDAVMEQTSPVYLRALYFCAVSNREKAEQYGRAWLQEELRELGGLPGVDLNRLLQDASKLGLDVRDLEQRTVENNIKEEPSLKERMQDLLDTMMDELHNLRHQRRYPGEEWIGKVYCRHVREASEGISPDRVPQLAYKAYKQLLKKSDVYSALSAALLAQEYDLGHEKVLTAAEMALENPHEDVEPACTVLQLPQKMIHEFALRKFDAIVRSHTRSRHAETKRLVDQYNLLPHEISPIVQTAYQDQLRVGDFAHASELRQAWPMIEDSSMTTNELRTLAGVFRYLESKT